MSHEFQPLFQIKGPKILVEGEETQEDTPNQLLFWTGAKIKSTKSNILLKWNNNEKEVVNSEIQVVPTLIEKRLQKLDETIEGVPPSSNSSHSDEEYSKNTKVVSQKGRSKQCNVNVNV